VWKFPALAMRDTKISRGDRICQFRIVPTMIGFDFEIVDDLGDNTRGGFGSTGIK
jgi:dUTP pyrophosphatase